MTKRGKQFNVYFSGQDIESIKKAAAMNNQSISKFIRTCVERKLRILGYIVTYK